MVSLHPYLFPVEPFPYTYGQKREYRSAGQLTRPKEGMPLVEDDAPQGRAKGRRALALVSAALGYGVLFAAVCATLLANAPFFDGGSAVQEWVIALLFPI